MSKVYTPVCVLLIYLLSEGSSKSVCLGDRLALTCSGSGSTLAWNVSYVHGNADALPVAVYSSNKTDPPNLTVNQVLLNFSVTSTLPLTSTVVINNVTANANGIRLNCIHSGGMLISREISVVTPLNAVVSIPTVMRIEQYGASNVTVILEWTKQQLESYNIAITPDAVIQMSSENNTLRAQLIVAYNIVYGVTFVTTLCDQNATKVFELLYVVCDYPLELSASVSGYSVPALVGSNITISCLADSESNTSVTITCMDNGQWEPDPRQVNDKCHNNFAVTSTEVSTTFQTICNDHGNESKFCTFQTTAVAEPKGNAVMYVVGSSIGVFIIIVIAGVVVVILVISKKGRLHKHEVDSVSLDSQDVNANHLTEQNCYLGEYSLLQHIPPRQDHHDAPVTPTGQARTLVYAELGPLSLKQQSHIIENAFDDNRVDYVQINTTVSVNLKNIQPVSADKDVCADGCLNLDSLLMQIKPDITSHWYKFGKVIGVDKRVLDKCLQYPPEESIIEVCDQWLRNHTGQPTWTEVAEALRQINFPILASKVEQIYETGLIVEMLPKEENMTTSIEESSEIPPPIPPKLM